MVFVTAGYSGKRFVFEKAKALGVSHSRTSLPCDQLRLSRESPMTSDSKIVCAIQVKSIVLDGPDSWCKELEEEGIIKKYIAIDFSDADTVFDRCLEAIRACAHEVGELDGVTTFCEIAVPLASRLAERLGLPCNSVTAVDNARDKHATRDIMMKAGLPTPLHYR